MSQPALLDKANASRLLADKAIATFKVNETQLQASLARNPILVTALNPVIGYAKAAELAFVGETIMAKEALDLGLVNKVVPEGASLDAALEMANKIAANAPLAVRATKQILRAARDWSEQEAWTEQRRLAKAALKSEDAREGARAFAEKRPPVWKGR